MQKKPISSYLIGIWLFALVALISCKTTNSSFSDLLDKYKDFDKYTDSYENFVYYNDGLDFRIDFDGNWRITTSSIDFNEMQKKYAEYVLSERSELLFIGQNEKNNLCVRCLAEVLGLSIDEYAKNVKSDNNDKNRKYKIKYLEEKKITFDKFEAFHVVYEVEINANNIFVFDSILFKNFNNNFRLEFWTSKANYESQKEFIQSIMRSINFDHDEVQPETTSE
jgi:hypothetical protein